MSIAIAPARLASPSSVSFWSRRSYASKVRLAQAAVVIGLILMAELLTRLSEINNELLPPPSTVAIKLFELVQQAEIRVAVWMLLYQLAMSIGLSAVIGILLGYLVAVSERVEKVALPVVLLVYSIPQVTILPLFVLYFGPESGSKIAFGVSHGMFAIALSVVAGLQKARANPLFSNWAISLGASPLQKLLRVHLPISLGSILVGLRLSISMCLLGVLLADIYVSTKGVGYYARFFTETLQGPKLFALITLLACLAMVINSLVSLFEKRSSRWQTAFISH